MKTLLLTLLIAISGAAHADDSKWQTFWDEEDKQKHMALSALGANILYSGFENMSRKPSGWTKKESAKAAFITMMSIGLAKEVLLDHNNTMQEHGRDMLANAIGSGTVIIWRIEW